MSMETITDAVGNRFVRYHRQMDFNGRMHAVRIDVYRADGESVAHKDHTYTDELWLVVAHTTTNAHAEDWRLLLRVESFQVLATANEVARDAHAFLEFRESCAL